ncbi:MAG: carboxy terminal-processing peptidase, partial [Proteobacteria bacterium]|nr:carboxy terminal-processing peptidase [Pseudomonadota bacterium]
MTRHRPALALLLGVSLLGCSPKAPAPGESPKAADSGKVMPTTPPTAPVAGPGSAPAVAPTTPADPREAEVAKAVVMLLQGEHLLKKPIDDDLSRAAFDTYLERIDATKLFLLKADRDALATYADKLDDELKSGSLDLAHAGEKIFTTRAAQIETWVLGFLAAPMDFTNEEYVELDPKKIEPAASEADLKERWRQRIELEVMERVVDMEDRLARQEEDKKKKKPGKPAPKPAAGSGSGSAAPSPASVIPATPAEREDKARAELAKSYEGRFARLKNPAPLDAVSDVVNAVTSSLDPHTTWLPPADKANFDIHLSGQLEGIGAVLREKDHGIEIVELVPGGAAYRQGGVSAGDLVVSVAQDGKDPVDVLDMRIDDVVKMIRGPKGSIVHLRLKKATGTEESVTITRDKIVLEESYARGAMLQAGKGQPSFGYIHLPSFYGGKGNPHTAAHDVRRLILDAKARKAVGIIIDLRSNGGGLLGDAIEMTGQLVDQGPVVQVQNSRGKKEILADTTRGTDFDGPVVVMIDQFSASASEIVAGALQDYHRAVLVGTTTHGKGTVQSLEDLAQLGQSGTDIGALKITIQQFFRPDGASTQLNGVVPDIALPNPAGHIESGERELPHAVAWSSTAAAPHDDWHVTYQIPELAKKSAVRVAKDPILAKIASGTALLKARRNDTKVPLARVAYDVRRKAQKAELDAAIPDLEKAPAKLTVTVIEDPTAAKPA